MEVLCAGPGLKHTRLMIRRKPVGLGLATGSSPGLGPTRRSRGGSPTGGREDKPQPGGRQAGYGRYPATGRGSGCRPPLVESRAAAGRSLRPDLLTAVSPVGQSVPRARQ